MTIEVLKPGLLTTVQDGGRRGHQHLGVPVNGPMDEFAQRAANLLAGNEASAAALEITLQGPTLRFAGETLIAITGGDFSVTANQLPVPAWRPVLLRAGTTLEFGECRSGCRAALAVRGGIEVPPMLGSRSTFLRGGWGGLEGRALRRGDSLTVGGGLSPIFPALKQALDSQPVPFAAPSWSASHLAPVGHEEMATIRITPGRHWDEFAPEMRERFLGETYAIGTHSDRMGYRLEGAAIARAKTSDLLSEGVAFGTIQVPPDGAPIVLMADRQTVGGYPKIAQVAAVDLPRLAQRRPRERIRFTLITPQESQRLDLARELALKTLEQSLASRRNP